MGMTLVPLLIDTSCYYLAWIVVLTFIASRLRRLNRPIVVLLSGLLIFQLFGAEGDVLHAMSSWWLLGGLTWFVVDSARRRKRSPAPHEGAEARPV